MLGSPVRNAAIGRMRVFLTLSLIASALQDLLSSLVSSFPENLFRGIRDLCLGDVNRLEELFSPGYGRIAGLFNNPLYDFGGKDAKCISRIGSGARQASDVERRAFKSP
jgi:hypothetical protein